jgi:hypothetical protein
MLANARSLLLGLRPAADRLDISTRKLINHLGLARRGTRAGRHHSWSSAGKFVDNRPGITVITARRAPPTDGTNIRLFLGRRDVRVTALRTVSREALNPPVNVGVFNACSVHNKAANINDWIASSNLRLAALVETWHDSIDCPDLIACAPPGYHYIERVRPRTSANASSTRVNHGGVCLFYHSSLHAKRLTFVDYKTFELVSA